jgi:HlyD family secretion protein
MTSDEGLKPEGDMVKLSWRTLLIVLVSATVYAFASPHLCSLYAQDASSTGGRHVVSKKTWAAVAPGRVEAASREIKIAAPVLGRIAEVLVNPNDKVFAGELLVRLDNTDLQARVAIAETQVSVRRRARNATTMPRGAAARRKLEDELADTEQAVAEARVALDRATAARHVGSGSDESVNNARAALTRVEDKLRQQQADLRRIKAAPGTPLPTQTEGDLNVARGELSLADAMLEKTRIRAPIAGTVLQVPAKAGELAMPSPDHPLVVLADLSTLRVRAEVDERDIGQVHVGQAVTLRASAFPDREFAGQVASVSQLVGPGGVYSRGARRLTDVDVVEVVVELIDPGPLRVGIQVDVYFRNELPKTDQAPGGTTQATQMR